MTDNYKNLISTPNASTYEKELENWEFIDTIDLIPYIEKYDGDGCGMNKSISYLIPYCLAFAGLWIVILILWYLVGLPLGIGTSTII